jgi:predicted NUDIX family NTP pyrophosphohydrolase
LPKVSAGLLMCRRCAGGLEFLLAHPGGPFFAKKDDGAWTIPKGIVDPGEEHLDAGIREFGEETGFAVPESGFESLGEIQQKGGKIVHAWAFLGDCDPALLVSNEVLIEWPPRSRRQRAYPEIDRVAFFDADAARIKMLPAQVPFIDRALAVLGEEPGRPYGM